MLHLKKNEILSNKSVRATENRLSVLGAFLHYQKPINLKTIRDYVEGIDTKLFLPEDDVYKPKKKEPAKKKGLEIFMEKDT